MTISDKQQIEVFLKKFCEKMEEGKNSFIIVPRTEYKSELAKLGISINTAKAIIGALTFEHYCKGPEPDDNNPNEHLWIFGYMFGNNELYIKLSDDLSFRAKCVSFHRPNYDMNYPYNNQEEC